MATVDKKYLDLEGLSTYTEKVKELIDKKVDKDGENLSTDLGAYKIKTNKNGLVVQTAALSYNDLQDKPTIGNGTLTLQVNGTSVGTFTANAVDDKTLNIKLGDFGLKGAMHFVGTSTTDPIGPTGATVDGYSSFESGDVVLYNTKEFVYNGAK